MKNLFQNVWSGERYFDVAGMVTSNETKVHAHVAMGSKEESSIAARRGAVVRAGRLLSTVFLTANAMPCWMALRVMYLRSHLDSENLQKSHECFLAASRQLNVAEKPVAVKRRCPGSKL